RDEWLSALDTNLLAGVSLVRAAAERLLASGGTATLIASIAGLEAGDAPLAYGAAKAALVHAAKGLSRALAPSVRINVVAPGNVLLPRGIWERRLADDPEGVETILRNDVPLERFGTPDEIADAVVFLSSARASFITGVCLVVDGGQTRAV
ncbi:MAG: SDR family NAD(P)-dependent oxidoreductase, partial [Gaiellaceae bacterium]